MSLAMTDSLSGSISSPGDFRGSYLTGLRSVIPKDLNIEGDYEPRNDEVFGRQFFIAWRLPRLIPPRIKICKTQNPEIERDDEPRNDGVFLRDSISSPGDVRFYTTTEHKAHLNLTT